MDENWTVDVVKLIINNWRLIFSVKCLWFYCYCVWKGMNQYYKELLMFFCQKFINWKWYNDVLDDLQFCACGNPLTLYSCCSLFHSSPHPSRAAMRMHHRMICCFQYEGAIVLWVCYKKVSLLQNNTLNVTH